MTHVAADRGVRTRNGSRPRQSRLDGCRVGYRLARRAAVGAGGLPSVHPQFRRRQRDRRHRSQSPRRLHGPNIPRPRRLRRHRRLRSCTLHQRGRVMAARRLAGGTVLVGSSRRRCRRSAVWGHRRASGHSAGGTVSCHRDARLRVGRPAGAHQLAGVVGRSHRHVRPAAAYWPVTAQFGSKAVLLHLDSLSSA